MSVEVRLGDCLARMAELEPASIDAIVMDPPYCSGGFTESGRSYAKSQGLQTSRAGEAPWFVGDNMTTPGISWLLRNVALGAVRILRSTGHMLCFMDWRMIPVLVPVFESAGLRYQSLVVWDKCAPSLGNGFKSTHEMVAHFTNGNPIFHTLTGSNVLRHPRVPARSRDHATQKPVPLLCDLLRVVCPPGGTVLDPFAGSGSTLVAAASLGMSAIGFDRDAGYVEVAKRRLVEDVGLFDAAEAVA